MYYECCVCKSSRQDAILHHFPLPEKRLNLWLKCLNRDDFYQLSPEEISKLFVCQKHFERRFISSKSRLIAAAYPSLFTEDEISTGIPSQKFADTENMDSCMEHSYSRKRHFDHTYFRREPLKAIPARIEPMAASSSLESSSLLNIGIIQGSQPQLPAAEHSAISNLSDGQSQVTGLDTIRSAKGTRPSRRRLITKLKDLTPQCKKIYEEFKKSKQQTDYYRRAKRAMKFNKEESFQKLTQNMNPYGKRLMKMQINLCTKSKKGRRFTQEEKLIALSIMKQSPKCYKFLHKIFILPSRSTLNKMVANLKIQSGICPHVFNLITKEIESWDEKKKMCSVVFDEMSLECGLTYDKNKDKINGLVELNERKNSFADHALVFLLRGAVHKWQQPVAFYFCEGATKGPELKTILKDVVSAVAGCGLSPIALICDQGSAFQSALNSIKEDTRRDQLLANQISDGTVMISGINLKIVFDPPHLVKGLRNNFLNKDIVLDGKRSKWSDIVDVYKTDCSHAEARLLHKLNDQHVIPDKIKKMKVKNCVKVFSQTVSAALSYTANFSHYADGTPISKTLKNTAETVLFFDKLFDSVNGATTFSKKKKGKILRTAVTAKSPHHAFWRESIKKLEKMKYVQSNGLEKTVPSLKNYIITLRSFIGLWQFFSEKNMTILRPRYFNSDPIENFFGQVRAYNYRNNNPNCHSFMCTFKSLLITRVIKFHSETFNCEDDPADQIINLKLLFDEGEDEDVEPGHPKADSYVRIVEQARRERLNIHSRAYTAGWVVRKIIEKSKTRCDSCKKSLLSEESGIHQWISHREYSAAKNSLNYPSEGAVRCFGTVVNETNEFLEHNAHEINISRKIKENTLSKNSFAFIDCAEHKNALLNHFITLTVRFTIMNWCNTINKILKGTDIVRLENRSLPPMQKKALEKFKKKLKNVKYNK